MLDVGKFDAARRAYALNVTVKGLTRTLQTYYGCVPRDRRDVGIPRSDWVADALAFLTQTGDAEAKSRANYTVYYTRTKRDTIERFAKKMLDLERARKKDAVARRYAPEDLFKSTT
jgi:hypothetical protein